MTKDDHDRPTADKPDRALFWEAMANTFRPWAGWVFYGFGALLVVIGYLGISGEAVVAKQLPYLISGGIGGILLAVLGAYLLGIEELRKDSGRLDRMEKQVEELHRALLARPDAPVRHVDHGAASGSDNGHASASGFIAVPSGSSFHLDSCALVAGKAAEVIDASTAAGRGLAPCKVCEPSLAS